MRYHSFSLFFISLLLVLQPALADVNKLSATQAYDLSAQGKVVLVDIRSESEWLETGVAPEAVTLSIHQQNGVTGFTEKLLKLLEGDKNKAVALICAGGVRSGRAQEYLQQQGFTRVMDIPEGMLGGWFTQGWIEQGLPIKRYLQAPVSF